MRRVQRTFQPDNKDWCTYAYVWMQFLNISLTENSLVFYCNCIKLFNVFQMWQFEGGFLHRYEKVHIKTKTASK